MFIAQFTTANIRMQILYKQMLLQSTSIQSINCDSMNVIEITGHTIANLKSGSILQIIAWHNP